MLQRLDVPSLNEQQRIAEILDTIDQSICKTEQVLDKLQQMKQGLLHDLLTRGIDENGALGDPRHFKDSEVGSIPRHWNVWPLKQCLMRSPQNGLYLPASEIGTGTLLVGQTSFTPERSVDFSLARRARASASDLQRYELREDDILMSRVFATVQGVGQPVLVPPLTEPAVYESNMMRLRADERVILSALLFYWLQGAEVRRRVVASAFASNQASINQTALSNLPVCLPPMAEQFRMLDVIKSVTSRVAAEQASLEKLRSKKSALMHDLLTGRVRVPVREEAHA